MEDSGNPYLKVILFLLLVRILFREAKEYR